MRVLVANKFWYRRGGLENVVFDECSALERAGAVVGHFACAHPENVRSPWESFFAPYIELGDHGHRSTLGSARALLRMFHNVPAARKFGELVARFRPDVVHVHGIHRQISPSILAVARTRGIPVVQTCHDYHAICPADVLLRGGEHVCDPPRCTRLNYAPALSNRCLRHSFPATAISVLEMLFQEVRGIYDSTISFNICPSQYVLRTMRSAGHEETTLRLLPNPLSLSTPSERAADHAGPVVFAGAFTREKGADLLPQLVDAGFEVTAIGAGDLESLLTSGGVRIQGWLTREALALELAGAGVVVVPSRVPEAFSLAALEAMACGAPVVGSRVGAIPELIVDGVTGLLAEPGSGDELVGCVRSTLGDPVRAAAMGAAARSRAASYSIEQHSSGLLQIYTDAIQRQRKRSA